MNKITWPAWFSSPDGQQSEIFERESDVPRGWTSGAEKITVEAMRAPANEVEDELDAEGQPWDPEIHAAGRTKTQAGLWRKKVGARPASIQHDL